MPFEPEKLPVFTGLSALQQYHVLLKARGRLVTPLDSTPDDFSEVIKSRYANGISGKEFALRAKVAAWLFDLERSDLISPYPCKENKA